MIFTIGIIIIIIEFTMYLISSVWRALRRESKSNRIDASSLILSLIITNLYTFVLPCASLQLEFLGNKVEEHWQKKATFRVKMFSLSSVFQLIIEWMPRLWHGIEERISLVLRVRFQIKAAWISPSTMHYWTSRKWITRQWPNAYNKTDCTMKQKLAHI